MIADDAKKFAAVFAKVKLPAEIMRDLGQADVRGLRVNMRTRQMQMVLHLSAFVHENCFAVLEKQLLARFPLLDHVAINVCYNVAELDQGTMIRDYWPNVLYTVGRASPLCGKILEQSAYGVKDGALVITLRQGGVFLFAQKGVEGLIRRFLEARLGWTLPIRLLEEDGNRKPEKGVGARDAGVYIVHPPSPVQPETQTPPPPAPTPKKSTYQADYIGKKRAGRRGMKLSKAIENEPMDLTSPLEQDTEITVAGRVISSEIRETKSGKKLVTFDLTDGADSVSVKFFTEPEKFEGYKPLLKAGAAVAVNGKVQFDDYAKELNIMAWEMAPHQPAAVRTDDAPVKRVELHLHTQMSAMDGTNSVTDYIKTAAGWGHKAIALTDHGVVQAFPEAMAAAKGKDIKILYGVEAYLIDDMGAVVQCPRGQTLDDTFVVFDIETTGLSKDRDNIIEIGAVKVEKGAVLARFSTFVQPNMRIPEKITQLTGITDSMVENAPAIEAVLPDFLDFAGDAVLVAHNAAFDMGFVTAAAKKWGKSLSNTVLDTVELSRTLFPELPNHKLKTVAKHCGATLKNHHRAVDDAEATAEILIFCLAALAAQSVHTLQALNAFAGRNMNKSKLRHSHAILLAKNRTGLKNLYELISLSHLRHFVRRPRMPKSDVVRLREGLLIGSACEAGELFKAVKENKPAEFIEQLAQFYDYYEIQPTGNNLYLLREGQVNSVQDLEDLNKKIVALGAQYGKPVVAAGDVHFLNKEDEVYRRIIMTGEGFKDADKQAPLYLRTTAEMLREFAYLGAEKAAEVVIHNTNKIADMIESIEPIPSGTFPPFIEGAEQTLKEATLSRAKEIYGDALPPVVSDRLTRELDSIIKNGFAVMYVIAQKLVAKSEEDGYLVGSRGSVGSSLAATMAGITEVNPLSPHYVCKRCRYSDFDSDVVKSFAGASGCDMPDQDCPTCGEALVKDGHDIPFETFLGFDGDKEPDIDLNFSGEYQSRAHAYTEELFGADNVFKAGTIGTLADKTAYGYVRKYMEEKGLTARNAEINRLKIGCTGVKKTTGQHPGGLVVLPKGHSIYEFCPVQRPANDMKSNVTTTHFDYHAIEGRLLKLDLLGHDVPTIIRMLHDTSGVDPRTVDLGNKRVISLFTSPEALGVRPEEINCQTGSLGLPEFGTGFVRGMLLETKPTTFAELVRISGLSHGTDVWINNAQELVKNNIATLKEIIPTRDDIMVYLINKGVERLAAFKIMESVRRGRGVTPKEEEIMLDADVPEWYIESCKKIKYMFPKGHAVAYVMMTMRIGYFKIYHPYSFYAATFSVKAEDFNYETMCRGAQTVQDEIKRLQALGLDMTAKEKSALTILELVRELYARGLKFTPLNLYEAAADKFAVTPNGLMPPLCAVAGLGANVAQNIVESRAGGDFATIEDFRERTKTNKTVIELLKKNGILDGIPETNQMSLF